MGTMFLAGLTLLGTTFLVLALVTVLHRARQLSAQPAWAGVYPVARHGGPTTRNLDDHPPYGQPAAESVLALSRAEAEDMLDWLENVGHQNCHVSYAVDEQTLLVRIKR